MKLLERSSLSTKLLALSLMRLLFTHLYSQLLFMVLVEALVLVRALLRTCKIYICYVCTQKNVKDKDRTGLM